MIMSTILSPISPVISVLLDTIILLLSLMGIYNDGTCDWAARVDLSNRTGTYKNKLKKKVNLLTEIVF